MLLWYLPSQSFLMPHRYVNQEEPSLAGHSVTVKAGAEQIQAMRMSAAHTFRPEMAQLLQVGVLFFAQLFCESNKHYKAAQHCVKFDENRMTISA